jgi:hypothetical protein
MRESDFQIWKHEAVHEAKALNEQCVREFRLGSWPRWEANLEQGRFYFVEDGIPRVAASVVVVGSYSTKSETWLWSWANERIPSTAKDGMEVVRDWGGREGIRDLTEPKFPADEEQGWELASVALRLLNAICIYRYPFSSGFVWVVFKGLNFLAVASPEKETAEDAKGRITCNEHGAGLATYVCQHLSGNPAQEWVSDRPGTKNPWPDAWCAECQQAFNLFGQWNDENSANLGLKLLCHRCYESAWSEGTHRWLEED